MTGSFSTLGTSSLVETPETTRKSTPGGGDPRRGGSLGPPAGARTRRSAVASTSGEVLQVQTSSRAESEPKETTTWSGWGREATWVFQTRPEASRVEWRWAC